jgi:lipopolysaccharide export system protein LptA
MVMQEYIQKTKLICSLCLAIVLAVNFLSPAHSSFASSENNTSQKMQTESDTARAIDKVVLTQEVEQTRLSPYMMFK